MFKNDSTSPKNLIQLYKLLLKLEALVWFDQTRVIKQIF